jgi:predicted RNA binding protein YcfA (HicA-like mRNA interferase family)
MTLRTFRVIKQIEEDGWYLARTRGSHRQFKHPTKSGLVTVAGKPSDDLAPGTLNSILKKLNCNKRKKSNALCNCD